MSYEKEIEALELEWSPEDGFFGRVRQGQFAAEDFQRALGRLAAISIEEDAEVPRRVVSLLWYIPVFMQWQAERVRENGADVTAYANAIQLMTNEVERLLGVP
ncbi:hypothetical protein [Polyangium fumosum]|uniref:Uncharacterized protein n=1 Tax=Polyangium fumosum TaxID=889272 RepID=A0A4U1JBF1_9BACT|nr:hypothetical protein [Polyangium fumosum]TKD06472.1 hypothetical protein E8A74_19855 [Polyangium fumosum]